MIHVPHSVYPMLTVAINIARGVDEVFESHSHEGPSLEILMTEPLSGVVILLANDGADLATQRMRVRCH